MKLTANDLRTYVGSQVYIKDRQGGRLLIGELSKVSVKGTNQYGQSCVLRFRHLVRFSDSRQQWVPVTPRTYGLTTGSFRATRIAGEIVLTHGRRNSLIIFCSHGGEIFDFHKSVRTWDPSLANLSTSESDDVA